MPVNKKGFDKKIKLIKQFSKKGLPQIVQDAGTYLNSKLVGEILNGMPGDDYPKSYPAGAVAGSTGFVGVVTSNLRRSISVDQESEYVVNIRQIYAQLAPYHKYVAGWTSEKYSMNFYDIAVKLYGPKVTLELFQYIKQAHKRLSNGQSPSYNNPFPQ